MRDGEMVKGRDKRTDLADNSRMGHISADLPAITRIHRHYIWTEQASDV